MPGKPPRRSARTPTGPISLPAEGPSADTGERQVLEEVAGPEGILLWKVLRDVMLWAVTTPDRRVDLFPPELEERRRCERAELGPDRDLHAALADLEAVYAHLSSVQVGPACERISAWAGERGRSGTQLVFLQASALVERDAGLAYRAGRLARTLGDHATAEEWFRTAIRFGRKVDWEHYVHAHLALANSYFRIGRLTAAEAFASRGLRAARRYGLRHLLGLACHEMLLVAARRKAVADANARAEAAFRSYGASHPRIPVLAHDVAVFWLDCGRFARALPVFSALLPRITEPVERVCVLANLVQAAAGTGDRPLYERHWVETVQLLVTAKCGRVAADVWLALAEAASLLSDWEHAEAAAGAALDTASPEGPNELTDRAHKKLEAAREHRAADEVAPRESTDLAERANRLAECLVRSLTRSTAGAS